MTTTYDSKSCKAGCTFYDAPVNKCGHSLLSTPKYISNPQLRCSMFTKSQTLPIASCKWKDVDVIDGAPGRNCTKSACPNTPLCSQYELATNLCRDCDKWNKDNVKATLRKNIYAGRCPSAHSPNGGWSYEDDTCKSFIPKPVPAIAATCENCDWWKENKNLGRMQSIKGAVVAIGDCASPNSSYTQSTADHICPQHKSKTAKKETCGTCICWSQYPNSNKGDCTYPPRAGKNISKDTEPSAGCHMAAAGQTTKPPIGKEVPCKWAGIAAADGAPFLNCQKPTCTNNSNWHIVAANKGFNCYEPEKQKQTCGNCGWSEEIPGSIAEVRCRKGGSSLRMSADHKASHCPPWKPRDDETWNVADFIEPPNLAEPKPCERCESLTTNTFTIKFDDKLQRLCERCQAGFRWLMAGRE